MNAVGSMGDLLGGLWRGLEPPAAGHESAETARLSALRAYAILDTGPEDAFDRVVELARTLFGSPIAAVAFIDADRAWFKARSGFQVTEARREHVFCDHVIRQDGVMVIPDLSLDPRFADNPLVTADPRMRFYAGAPLCAPGGERLGTVCIMSPQPRDDFSEADGRRLAALAGIASHEMELRYQAARAERLAAERGVLLQAIEHRLRGGLRLVSCVLEAQAIRSGDSVARRALYEAADRVAMIESVHQQLFQPADVFHADARDYLLALVGNLQDAALDDAGSRPIALDIDRALVVDCDRLPVLGLVLTELLTNALRHGGGAISVAIRRDAGAVVVSVADEGKGFPSDTRGGDGARRLGLRLVSLLALPDGVSIEPSRRQRITVRMRG